ncbi:exodeoxyribonuclease VII small subunit [Deinococcus petrolearius]|uniref:Exodeoxyribonuclease VII small subunit n=1 Tax=Deinococcus petrolearius TaxID=1751295 RepID=A0ABW1DKY7_9DEIO
MPRRDPTPGPQEALSYREAYARLARIAAELEGGEADLDRVLPLLEEAREAYAACQARLGAVRAALSGWAPERPGDEPSDDPGPEAPDDGPGVS